jgi:predicted heme/steroid binding protein
MYAHWRDGTQYVGTTGRTLGDALDAINKQEEELLAKYSSLLETWN